MSTTPTTTVSSGGTHQHHHRGRRLRNFILPDGREVHIALSPEDAETLRQRLNAIRKPDEPFDLVISGSPEHLDHLRTAHTHHENRREALKQKHGEAFDEFENVRAELEALGSELHMLTDHAVSLDANFSKYGYSAHLRSYDHSEPGSSRSSISGFHDPDHEKRDWEAEKRNGRIMKVYKKPTVRQYFHKGLLWRASETTEVASFELFVDLLYVGILAINGDHVGEDPTAHELLRFSITFIMSWKIWSDLALVISWFETDDILQRVSVMIIMVCLFGLTTNMIEGLHDTYTTLVSFYLTSRFFMGSYYIILAGTVPMVRGVMITQAILTVIPGTLWIGSIHVEYPKRLALIWTAIFIDLTAGMMIVVLIRAGKFVSKSLGEWSDRVFEFYPAVNIEHKTERTNAFVALVFGYSVVAIIYQNAAHFGMNAFFGKAALGLVQAFCFNWIYFELDGADLFQHAIRRNVASAMLWSSIHLPFIMSFVLAAGSLSKLVVATDCHDAELEDLTEFYQHKSEHEIPIGLRWFYCAGLGIALFCMGLISLSHIHKDTPGTRIPKRLRLLNRFLICIILMLLPLSHSLNSLHLIATTTALTIWVLMLELWGMSCWDESFFGEKRACKYTARCKISKKDLESAVKGGNVIKVEELKERGEKGLYVGA
ncbi:bacterial low temperature requirement A protein-domain-containing protein [Rhexocercosporidium sp. MPI-PUGE-AT-0058]|nr:bacterial low temperature requirement A protein-domain-containing protein [Rhexocercosporidium sp. MPI-PUGE-AT-0058]